MPDREKMFQIPPVVIHERVSTLANAGEHLGWQIRAWNVQKVHDEFGITGQNIRSGVADTGISKSHTKEGGDLENIEGAKSFVDRSHYDKNGHGSHCSSHRHAVDNGSGMIGVTPDAIGFHAKVLSDGGSGGDKGIADGIDWLADRGCQVISLSLGSSGKSTRINAAINAANDAGVIVVAAAGNDGRRNGIDHPAASSQCIVGGAVDNNLKLASFQDKGRAMQARGVVGAGVRVYACNWNSGYTLMSGTSMGTPHVAGLLDLAIDAEIEFFGKQKTFGYEGAVQLVERFHLDLGSSGFDESFGLGAFNVYAYVKWCHENRTENPDDDDDDDDDDPIDPVDPPKQHEKVAEFTDVDSGNEYTILRRIKQ